jgi:YggT family protein
MKEFFCALLNLYVIAIVLRMVLSWFPLESGGVVAQVYGVLRRITDPLLEPLRRVVPPMGGFDLSPLIALVGLQLIVGRLILRC